MPVAPEVNFRLNPLLSRFVPRPVASVLAPPLESLLALRRVERTYARLQPFASPSKFARAALEALDVRFAPEGAVETIPPEGPLVLVANHPYGGIEGLYLYSLLAARRPDVRILGNELLAHLPNLAPAIFAVNVLGGRRAAQQNASAMRRAIRWVEDGGALIVFPAGEVATVNDRTRTIVDPPWHRSIARLLRITKAPVVPVFVDGANSGLFHAAGRLHARLRTALLPRELFNKRGRTIRVRVGAVLQAQTLQALEGDDFLCDYVRLHVYALACVATPRPPQARRRPRNAGIASSLEPPAEAIEPALLETELAKLDPSRRIASNNDLEVWCATQSEAPWILQELGRLREITFRAVGEGTGKARDLDLYDSYYDQLFVWNRATREIVGGYRIGAVDKIYARYGTRGLYTHTLFDFQRGLLPSLGPALELGRSFVRPEYQKSFAPLLLLWKGIAAYLVAHPQYRVLFGPVSISNDYSPASRALITGFLRAQSGDRRRARLVRARNPLPNSGGARLVNREAAAVGRLDALESVVASLEGDGKGVPVLLRQYLKLGAKVLGFNVDPAFGNSIDVLVAVDLLDTDEKVLAKYMGRSAADAFRAMHRDRRTAERDTA